MERVAQPAMLIAALVAQMRLARKAAALEKLPGWGVLRVAGRPDALRAEGSEAHVRHDPHCLAAVAATARTGVKEVTDLEARHAPVEAVKARPTAELAGVRPDADDE